MKPILLLFALCISAVAQITVTPSGSVNLAAPGPIGGTTPSTGAFTTLSATTDFQFAVQGGSVGALRYNNGGAFLALEGVALTPALKITGGLGFSSALATTTDIFLERAAANTLAQRNAAADQAFRIYGLYTDASNYHYGSLAMSDTALTISAVTAGTGVDNLDIILTPAGTGQVSVGPHLVFSAGTGPRLRNVTTYVDFTNNAQNAYLPLAFSLRSTGTAAPTIASAGTIAPTTPIVFISGTAAIDTITVPSPITVGGGDITLIPTGAFTTTTAGNIALASTGVVNKALRMVYDATTTKWYPSY